jgi:hypothetical protein
MKDNYHSYKTTLVRHVKDLPKKKTFKSYAEVLKEYSSGAKCSVQAVGYRNPKYLIIKFSGPLAQIPSLKNQKGNSSSGKIFLRADARARLSLMTDLFNQACKFKIPQYDQKIQVFCLILCAYRKNTFDEDNVATTVRDWLEPRYIRQKDRGWGVAVVPNDRMVKVYAIKKQKSDPDSGITEIVIKPYSIIEKIEKEFIEKVLTEL